MHSQEFMLHVHTRLDWPTANCGGDIHKPVVQMLKLYDWQWKPMHKKPIWGSCLYSSRNPKPLDDLTQTQSEMSHAHLYANCGGLPVRHNHLVFYSTLQDPIILSLIVLNVTRPNYLVFYINQPYKTQSSCLLLIHTRTNHLVSYSAIQDPVILSLTQPYKIQSSCFLINMHANVDKMHMHIGTQYLHFAVWNPVNALLVKKMSTHNLPISFVLYINSFTCLILSYWCCQLVWWVSLILLQWLHRLSRKPIQTHKVYTHNLFACTLFNNHPYMQWHASWH